MKVGWRSAAAVAVAAALAAGPAEAAESGPDFARSWPPLLKSGAFEQAKALCQGWLDLSDRKARSEGHKCLANLELRGAGGVLLEDSSQGEVVRPAVSGPEVDRALAHLDAAIALVPEDLSTHKGRLYLLLVAGRYDELAASLAESARLLKTPEALAEWLAYPAELFHMKQFEATLSLFRVLEKEYPDSHEVIANIGSVLTMLERDEEALPYLKRAVEMAPEDPMNVWNLARYYDFTSQLDLAETTYRRALELEAEIPARRFKTCLFAHFLAERRGKLGEACQLQQRNCEEADRPACRTTPEMRAPEEKDGKSPG